VRLCGLVAAALLLLAACGGGESGPATTQAADEAEARETAPDVLGATIAGAEASLAAFRGKPVFVKVFAAW
jgi:hypothetical protein